MTDARIPETHLHDRVVTLRPWDPESEADLSAWLAGVTDAEYARWNTPDHAISTPAEGRASLRRRTQQWRDGEAASFCITDTGDHTILGHVAVNAIAWNIRRAMVGFWLLPEARGRKLASRAVELATCWAFDSLGLHRLELYHAVGNAASCAVATRCGYVPEGVLRDRMFAAGDRDRFRDAHLHARLATDPRTSA